MKKTFFLLFAFLCVNVLCFAQQDTTSASKLAPVVVETKSLAGKGDKGCCFEKIKLLQDSAAVLQKSNPDLAKGLSDYADKEAKEMQEWEAKHDAKIKLLQDASVVLQQSNPDLAKGLQEMCKSKSKSQMQSMMQEKNEKEEIGEKVEAEGDK